MNEIKRIGEITSATGKQIGEALKSILKRINE